ncbi:uncharacterized protein B0H18DRAFT_968407 [Fomitopsis serialis]|uniref:uncharacterized protein n=1 Tax=Fomitopsis serialis TaxID=139415 RepID=UPI002007D249|nr:uncharacterized protein B0H18DRAFT_968407 [Neoantrodia serialis]KAH9938710.1 hypothetical protein B0H18DRAFT_968407 [Neoantrodia serialis]
MEHSSRTHPSAEEAVAPSSLITARFHHPHLLEIQRMPINWDTIDYCIQYIISILAPYRRDKEAHRLSTAFFGYLACNVLAKSQVDMGTLLVALSYVKRTQRGFAKNLHTSLNKLWEGEDLLLAALMTAHKYLNDACYPLSSWAQWASVYDRTMLRTVERHFLILIEYDLSVKEGELLSHYDGLMEFCVRKKGGWYQTMGVLPSHPVQQPAQSPKTYPTPIGAGRPRSDASQQHLIPSSSHRVHASSSAPISRDYVQVESPYPMASSSVRVLPEQWVHRAPASPRVDPPAPLLPAPPAPWHSEARRPLPPFVGNRGGRERSRSPPPRRPRPLPTPAYISSLSTAAQLSHGDTAIEHRRRWDPYPYSGRRARDSREHVLDHDDDPPRRQSRHSLRTPYSGDRYRRSHGRYPPCLPPLRDLPNLRDLAPDDPPPLQPTPPPSRDRHYDDPRLRRAPPRPWLHSQDERHER